MIRSACTFVLITVIQKTLADPNEFPAMGPIDPSIPTHCYTPPGEINLYECCPIAPLFAREEFEECGFKEVFYPSDRPEDCSSRTCLFQKHNLLNDDEKVNEEVFMQFLDKWAENQTNIADGLVEAKKVCFGNKDGPPIPQRPFGDAATLPCDIDKLLGCLRSSIIWYCNHREQIPRCKKLGDHMRHCRKYLYKEKVTE